jgi:hypothetical protein
MKSSSNKRSFVFVLLLLSLLMIWCFSTLPAEVQAQGLPWRDNAPPYDSLFGNHIDTHQQSKLLPNGDLLGFLYITFTGEYGEGGIPIAEHCDENTPPKSCVVGWRFGGKPGSATFVFHDGDHPIWLVDSRNDIPQPGGFVHFHWLDGPNEAGGLIEGQVYAGYFLELFAVRKFVFSHGGDSILVASGLDTATHINVVASFP